MLKLDIPPIRIFAALAIVGANVYTGGLFTTIGGYAGLIAVMLVVVYDSVYWNLGKSIVRCYSTLRRLHCPGPNPAPPRDPAPRARSSDSESPR